MTLCRALAVERLTGSELGYTRDTHADGRTLITIKALGVWDTVGTLGVPPVPIIGVAGSSDQYVSPRTPRSAAPHLLTD